MLGEKVGNNEFGHISSKAFCKNIHLDTTFCQKHLKLNYFTISGLPLLLGLLLDLCGIFN